MPTIPALQPSRPTTIAGRFVQPSLSISAMASRSMASCSARRSIVKCSISAASSLALSMSRSSSSRSAGSGAASRPGAFKRGAIRNATSSPVDGRLQARQLEQRAHSRAPGFAKRTQPGPHQRAVVPVERRHVARSCRSPPDRARFPRSSSRPSAARTPAATESASPHEASPLYGKPHSWRCGFKNATPGSGSGGTRWWSMTIASMPRHGAARAPRDPMTRSRR